MVENLLSVTRVSQVAELKKSEEAAEEVIVEAVSRCKKRFPDAQIRVDLPEDDMLFVPMDATLIVQVLINLMENAVRYAQTPIDIGLRRDGAWAEFSVRDFGPGIADDKKENLFDSVQAQPDSRRGGLGIGLTLCRSIITAHGGEIWEVNHPDGRCTVLIYPAAGGGRKMNGETILIVEDEQPIAHVLITILSANGYHTLQASTGTLARSIINSVAHV